MSKLNVKSMEVLAKIEKDGQTCVFNRRSKGREKGGFMRRSKLKEGSFGGEKWRPGVVD